MPRSGADMGSYRVSRLRAMKHIKGVGVIGGVVFWLALSASPVSAQWFADLYLGGAYTRKSDVTVKSPAVALAEANDTTNFALADQYETDFPLGVKGGLGVAWQLYPHVALFAEYRFPHFRPEFTFRSPPGHARLGVDLNTHSPVAGISL